MEEEEEKKDIPVDVGGRPPKYASPKKFLTKVNEYFNSGLMVKTMYIGKGDKKQSIQVPVPTISGLAIFLGFESRQSFYDYGKKKNFSYITKKAQFFIEKHYEEQLQIGNFTGAIFALKNMGWIDESKVVQINRAGIPLTPEERKALDDELEEEY